jgi:hypothetical protein
LFPLDHRYRLGPPRLIIRDNIWYKPDQALFVLRDALSNDPYSPMLKAWIAAFEARKQP